MPCSRSTLILQQGSCLLPGSHFGHLPVSVPGTSVRAESAEEVTDRLSHCQLLPERRQPNAIFRMLDQKELLARECGLQ